MRYGAVPTARIPVPSKRALPCPGGHFGIVCSSSCSIHFAEANSFMSGFLRRILPREKSFFQMFNQQAENVEAGAIAMVEMLEHFEDAAARADKVEDFEHIGDTITHNILRKLNQTFVTPFDREDIHELASKIDDVIDLVD